MADFHYIARNLGGQQIDGTVSAASQRDALASLTARQLFPVRVELLEDAIEVQNQSARRVKPHVLAAFYGQMADLLTAGVPLLRSLELLRDKASDQSLKAVLADVQAQVAEGTSLTESLRSHPRAFDELAVSMVRAGEEGGFMEDVLRRIAMFTEHQEALRRKVLGALVYPSFLLFMGLGIVAAMLVFFVPRFEPIFARLAERGSLPQATVVLMAMSTILQDYWLLVLIAVGVSVVAIRRWMATEAGKLRFDGLRLASWKFRLGRNGPQIVLGAGELSRSLSLSRFCRILGTLLKNGVPILHALEIARDATGNMVLSRAIAEAAESVSSGRSLAVPLSVSGQFAREIVEMISVGEEANNLENVLIGISDNLERYTGRRIDVVVRLLEPLMLLMMAAIVTFVIAALLLPVLNMSSAF
ncbi:MAG: type II secretion system F family protein [Planctomycetaceae bacterium]|nr:type II secretion system F family protein [Planctomycetaceae bacterium]